MTAREYHNFTKKLRNRINKFGVEGPFSQRTQLDWFQLFSIGVFMLLSHVFFSLAKKWRTNPW